MKRAYPKASACLASDQRKLGCMVRLFTKNRFWRFESAYFTCALLVTYFAGVIHRIIAKPRVIRSKGNFSGKRGGNFYFEKFQVMTDKNFSL